MSLCPFCRNEINPGATACGHCGAYVAVTSGPRKLLGLIGSIVFGFILVGLILVYKDKGVEEGTVGSFTVIGLLELVSLIMLFKKSRPVWLK